MKKLVVAWVAGFVFAMTLVVRWQLIGRDSVVAENVAAPPEPTEEAEPSVSDKPPGVRRFASAGWESVRVGARADLDRLRNLRVRGRRESDPVPEPAVDTLGESNITLGGSA